MATNQLRRVIQTLHRATLHHEGAGLTDGQLLESYVRSREEAAFAALVHRHGPMVWGVCRRVLGSHHDAEDAFQATFLVLVRKAASIVWREKVANWLYGVAHQTALKARATTAKRGAREKQVTVMPEPAPQQQELWNDLQPLLDQELSRLPDKYRALIALCDLEGKTRKEAARQLNLPEGTVASRLATARAMLAKRLARHGPAVSGGALAAVLSQKVASAGMPLSVASATIKAASLFAAGRAAATGVISGKAVGLAEGVLKTMLLTKLKIATAVLIVVTVLGTGAIAITRQVPAEKSADRPLAEKQVLTEKPAIQSATEKKEPADQPVKEKKEGETKPIAVSGIVKAVDAEKDTLTVAHKEGQTTFTVAKGANINIDGKPGELAELPTEANVTLSEFVDQRTARSIQAAGRSFWAAVKAVDAKKNTLTVALGHGEGEKTYTVAQDTDIRIDGKPGQLAGIPTGASVNLSLYVDQKTARSIGAEGTPVNGAVKAVNAQKNTITVGDKTFPVAPDADIGIDHKPGKLAGIPAGAFVGMTMSVDQTTVRRIGANGPSDFGTVKSVDVEKKTITVTGGPPEDRIYNVMPETVIRIDNKPGTLGEIPPGSGLHALNARVDRKTADSINAYGPGFHGIPVKEVDAEKNTITFDDTKAPAAVAGKTFPVAEDADIQIDGKPGKLTAVPKGAFLSLGLSVDLKTVRSIGAQGPGLGGCGGSPVKAVDADKNTITFEAKGSADVAGKTFTVAPDANIAIDGKPGKLSGLPPGSYVNLTLSVDQSMARHVHAQGPPVSGVVKAVDAEKSTVTVDDKTFAMAKDAIIVIGAKPGNLALAELPAGANVNLRLRVDQKTVHMIHVKAP